MENARELLLRINQRAGRRNLHLPIDCFLINAFSRKNVEVEKHVSMTLFAGILTISSSAMKIH